MVSRAFVEMQVGYVLVAAAVEAAKYDTCESFMVAGLVKKLLINGEERSVCGFRRWTKSSAA